MRVSKIRTLTLAGIAVTALGCVSVQRMPLDCPVGAVADGVQGTATTVAPSRAFLAQRGNDSGRLRRDGQRDQSGRR